MADIYDTKNDPLFAKQEALRARANEERERKANMKALEAAGGKIEIEDIPDSDFDVIKG